LIYWDLMYINTTSQTENCPQSAFYFLRIYVGQQVMAKNPKSGPTWTSVIIIDQLEPLTCLVKICGRSIILVIILVTTYIKMQQWKRWGHTCTSCYILPDPPPVMWNLVMSLETCQTLHLITAYLEPALIAFLNIWTICLLQPFKKGPMYVCLVLLTVENCLM